MTQNTAASIHQRLLNRARAEQRPFNELLQYYILERFLYRLGQSSHSERLILKGALLFAVWQAPLSRPTRDIDLLGRYSNDIAETVRIMQEVCELQPETDDGLQFNPGSVSAERIMEDATYQGVRAHVEASLGNAKVRFVVDVGFGDPVVPGASRVQLPTLLGLPHPTLLAYSRESAIAEKFRAMVQLGELNSRMKDFYDVWLLASRIRFDGETLGRAIAAAFAHRDTPLAVRPVALASDFARLPRKADQWNAFIRRHPQIEAPPSLAAVVQFVSGFLSPVVEGLVNEGHFGGQWEAGGPWLFT